MAIRNKDGRGDRRSSSSEPPGDWKSYYVQFEAACSSRHNSLHRIRLHVLSSGRTAPGVGIAVIEGPGTAHLLKGCRKRLGKSAFGYYGGELGKDRRHTRGISSRTAKGRYHGVLVIERSGVRKKRGNSRTRIGGSRPGRTFFGDLPLQEAPRKSEAQLL